MTGAFLVMSVQIAAYLMCFALLETSAISALPNTSGPEQGLQDSSKSFPCTYQQDYNKLSLKTRSTGLQPCSPPDFASAYPCPDGLLGTQRETLPSKLLLPRHAVGSAEMLECCLTPRWEIQGPAPLPVQAPVAGKQSRGGRMPEGEKGEVQVTKHKGES